MNITYYVHQTKEEGLAYGLMYIIMMWDLEQRTLLVPSVSSGKLVDTIGNRPVSILA